MVAGVPFFLFLLVLELVGAVIKPFALCMRLFANMVAGHVVLAVLISLIVAVAVDLGTIGGRRSARLLQSGDSVSGTFRRRFAGVYLYFFDNAVYRQRGGA